MSPFSRRQSRLHAVATLLLWLVGGLAAALAASGPRYRYGDNWWQEQIPTEKTALLLHFGPPQVSSREMATTRLETRKKVSVEAEFEGLEELEAASQTPLGGVAAIDAEDSLRKPTAPIADLPAGKVQDFSDQARILTLPEGVSIIGDGRFGAAAAFRGGPGLSVRLPQVGSVECWVRLAAPPEAETTVLSVAGGESRLILRPDGRLELRLRKPHGNPRADAPPGVRTAIEKRPAEIIAPDPVPLGRWTHVAIWAKVHSAPGNTAPFEARLTVDGTDVAAYLSEGHNRYAFLGRGGEPRNELLIGGGAFEGDLDEVRALVVEPQFVERPPMPWRDADASRPLDFDRPFFREDATLLHAGFESGPATGRTRRPRLVAPDGTPFSADTETNTLADLRVDGIRGAGLAIDSGIGFARVPIDGATAERGAIEFWIRPDNWDDFTGYWHHTPPPVKDLSIARLFATDGSKVVDARLPRAWNLERARLPIDPGHWTHVVVNWSPEGWAAYADGRRYAGGRRLPGSATGPLAWAEFGVADDVTVARGERPRIEIDEVVAYRVPLRGDEVVQARSRWTGRLDPIALGEARIDYKWSLARLTFAFEPLLPEGVVPATLRLDVRRPDGSALGPFTLERPATGLFTAVVSDGQPLATGTYAFRFVVADAASKPLIEETRPWELAYEPWRGSRAGIIDAPPPPWTPLEAGGRAISTRMTRYELGDDGLPAQIWAAGEPLLTGPVRILEETKAVTGTTPGLRKPTANDVAWEASFALSAGVARLRCRTEFDGMTRFELTLPSGQLGRVAMEIPLDARRATRLLSYAMGARGVSTASVGEADGVVLDSRPTGKKAGSGYGFFGHVDLNDRDRGLFWFCDNAAGWKQSPQQAAIEVVRRGGTVALVLNIVAEAGPYEATRPLVFGILPHPARPLPKEYRLYERVPPAENSLACNIFDAFYPWPMDPRGGATMALYPGKDPKHPEAGPSWDYAESCAPIMRSCKPAGLVTLYLSRYWFNCRAGAYDNWEWRSGENRSVSLTPSFVDYASWEMDQWIGRGIWDAIYLDECYESPCRNLEAGFSVRLPDGSEQPGVRNFDFRELMKRWRCIFTAHGRRPMMMAHHTHSWQYPGLVFADAVLDGENAPIVSLTSRDWIDSTSRERFECLQNARLWGMATFYMPFIAEGGFDDKGKSQFPVWQWRMARQAQSRFAHGETATVYEGQGAAVYDGYWRDLLAWGAGDPATCSFHPPWESGRYLATSGDDGRAVVSLYRRPQAAVVIASNPTREPMELVVDLDTAALGLPAEPKARSLDATFMPPTGADFTGTASVKKEAAGALAKTLADPLADDDTEANSLLAADDDELLEGADAVAAKEAARWEPRMEGSRLKVRIRPRDYRVIAVE